jgi:hypothetical protein
MGGSVKEFYDSTLWVDAQYFRGFDRSNCSSSFNCVESPFFSRSMAVELVTWSGARLPYIQSCTGSRGGRSSGNMVPVVTRNGSQSMKGIVLWDLRAWGSCLLGWGSSLGWHPCPTVVFAQFVPLWVNFSSIPLKNWRGGARENVLCLKFQSNANPNHQPTLITNHKFFQPYTTRPTRGSPVTGDLNPKPTGQHPYTAKGIKASSIRQNASMWVLYRNYKI